MCGRIVDYLTDAEIADLYKVVGGTRLGVERRPDYNVRPTQPIRAVRLSAGGGRELTSMRWGFVPSWSRELPKQAWINAKAETIAQKGMWKTAFQKRRALVPVSGFYEWQRLPAGGKQPFFISLEGRPMTFAGIWEGWREGQPDALESIAFATAAPSEEFQRFHDRQVVILDGREEEDAWLDPDTPEDDLLALLQPLPAGQLQFRPVGPAVSGIGSHGPDCIAEGKIDTLSKPLKIIRPQPRSNPEVPDQGQLF